MGLEEISGEAFEVVRNTAMDHAVWSGAAGSAVGALFARSQRFDTVPSVALVLGGHFVGHALYAEFSKKKGPIGMEGVRTPVYM